MQRHHPPPSLLSSPLMISGCSEVEPGRWHFKKKNDFTAPGSNLIYIFFLPEGDENAVPS